MWQSPATNTSKAVNVWNSSHGIPAECWQISYNQSCRKHGWVGQKKNVTGLGHVALGGSCERGNVAPFWEAPSAAGGSAGTQGASEAWRRVQRLHCVWQVEQRPARTVLAVGKLNNAEG